MEITWLLKVVTLKSQGFMSCVACLVLVKTSKQQYFVYIYFFFKCIGNQESDGDKCKETQIMT